MSIRQRWDAQLKTLFVRVEGPTDEDEFVNWAQELLENREIPRPRKEFVDLSAIEASEISSATLRKVAEAFSRGDTTRETRIAIVASKDLVYGLGRMYQAYRSEGKVQLEIFRDESEARAWLGIPADARGAGVQCG